MIILIVKLRSENCKAELGCVGGHIDDGDLGLKERGYRLSWSAVFKRGVQKLTLKY